MTANATRERILAAAADLLANGGTEAVSTRAVAAAANVQAPTLYRLFGDKQRLLDAVTAHGFEQYLAQKKSLTPTNDPVEDLRRGWDSHVEFGLTHPAFYVLMYGVPQPERRPATAAETNRLLRAVLERIAVAGRLRMPAEAAAGLIHATNTGVTLSLIATPSGDRDPELSARTREIILAAVTTGPDSDHRNAALATRALSLEAMLTDQARPLSAAETALLHEWLLRIANK
ncbi:TetR family transcriptional regulator [Nocardia brasiliensis]|uniref:TetR family transcriptional regulator n=1 Tax=Nocardia brasiliensis TaxID=37326 RepID=A0A6G9XTR9_NOCBR|nr:TetR/AcrR family transcriptional regulator [Nocardia brasiliensis]QIS04324.1 TetR family transcriptional regulator [Nocardia brasiliensis]